MLFSVPKNQGVQITFKKYRIKFIKTASLGTCEPTKRFDKLLREVSKLVDPKPRNKTRHGLLVRPRFIINALLVIFRREPIRPMRQWWTQRVVECVRVTSGMPGHVFFESWYDR